ncbi:caspase, EACC1-associated type [Kitasatospora sp. NPDC004289]
MSRAVDPGRSRVVLIGTSAYRDERLPDLGVVAAGVADLERVLTDPGLGGFPAEHCRTVPPDADLARVGEELAAAAEEAEDLLLVYFAGHGLIDRRGRLHLGLAGTRVDRLPYTALPFEAVRETFLDSRAENRLLILDSCFSGRAVGRPMAESSQPHLAELEVSGAFTLTSAPANRAALMLDGEPHTAFTGRLLRLLEEGSPQAGPMLTPADLFRHLRAQLAAEGLPLPQHLGTDTAGELGLVRNRQARTGHRPPVGQALPVLMHAAVTGPASPGRKAVPEVAERAIEEALRHTARADTKQLRRILLAAVAPVVAKVSVEQALGMAAAVSDPDRRQSVTADIAVVLAAEDPFRAIDMAQSLWEPYRSEAIVESARVDGHRDRAGGLYLLDTYFLSDKRPSRTSSVRWEDVVRSVAAFAPDRAEELADALPEGYSRTVARARVALALAAADPGRALRLLPDRCRPWETLSVAEALATVDPDRALTFLAPHADQQAYPHALVGVCRAVAATDPGRAARLAGTIADRSRRAEALAAVAAVAGAADPDGALEITRTIGDPEVEQAARADLAPVLAATDPHGAMALAGTVTDSPWTVYALTGIAAVLLGAGHRRSSAAALAAALR